MTQGENSKSTDSNVSVTAVSRSQASCARYCSKCFISIKYFNPQNYLINYIIIISTLQMRLRYNTVS